jgi:hypothetical protein
MYRIDNSSAATALAAPTPPGLLPNSYFSGGNPAAGIDATIVEAEWLNMVQEEISNVVTGNGAGSAGGAADLDKSNRTQLIVAIRREIANGVAGQIPDTSNFVHKTGDTMSGSLTVPTVLAADLRVTGNGVMYSGISGSNRIGFAWSGGLVQIYVDGSAQSSIATSAWVNANFATTSWTQSWVSANYASTGYVNGNFLNLGGGTVTGNLNVNGSMHVGSAGFSCAGGVDGVGGGYFSSDGYLAVYQAADSTRYMQYINGFSLQLQTPAVSGFDYCYNIQRYGSTWTQWRGSDMTFFNAEAAVGGNGAYFQVSDAAAKDEIEPETRGLDVVLQLQPKSFRRVSDSTARMFGREIGFIAQDVRDALPEAVAEVDWPGRGLTLVLTTDSILALVVNAIREMHALIGAGSK